MKADASNQNLNEIVLTVFKKKSANAMDSTMLKASKPNCEVKIMCVGRSAVKALQANAFLSVENSATTK